MKATTLVTSTMFAVTSAFTPASRIAFKSVGTRAFSRSMDLMANPKGKSSLMMDWIDLF